MNELMPRQTLQALADNHATVATLVEEGFRKLDGKGLPEYPNDFVTAVKEALRSKESAFETDYFDCRAYFKTGTLHIKFKRPDIVAQFNRVGAGESNNLGG